MTGDPNTERLMRKIRGDIADGYPLDYGDVLDLCRAYEDALGIERRRGAGVCPACNGHGCSACEYTGARE